MITVESLSKSFTEGGRRVRALDDVTIDVQQGAVYGVLGGAQTGKSTLARIIAGAERPDRGTVRVGDANVRALAGGDRRGRDARVAVAATARNLARERTVAGNIALPLERAGLDAGERKRAVGELLDLIGMREFAGHAVDHVTEGQRQRVGLARALAPRPEVLVADEPTAQSDEAATAGVLTVLDRARAEYGTTVLLLAADAAPVRRVADEVALLDKGRVVAQGTLFDATADPASALGTAVLPELARPRGAARKHDTVAEVVLVGFATVGALLPEAASRFGVTLSTIGGGLTRFGDTPVARFLLGVDGERGEQALGWVAEQGGVVRTERAAAPAQALAAVA